MSAGIASEECIQQAQAFHLIWSWYRGQPVLQMPAKFAFGEANKQQGAKDREAEKETKNAAICSGHLYVGGMNTGRRLAYYSIIP